MNAAERREALTTAAMMRTRGLRLETMGQVLQSQADELEAEMRGHAKITLHGRTITETLYTLVKPRETVHYREMYERLLAAGYLVGGLVPQNTLLAALQRSPAFRPVGGRRSGKYEARARLKL